MAKFCTLYSGSTGNSTYIGTSQGGILIDVGISGRGLCDQLCRVGVSIDTIKAIFVTHEHGDHISGVRIVASKYNIPVYATAGTLEGMTEAGKLNDKCEAFPLDGPVEAAAMTVQPFATSHDSRQSCGYLVRTPDLRTIAVCTDLGCMTDEVRGALAGADLVMLESNHDLGMLQNGPYPYHLKRRVMGDRGHLSNAVCAEQLPGLLQGGTTRFVLAHLSRENNFPALAIATARGTLELAGAVQGQDYLLEAAAPAVPLTVML